MVIIPHKYIRPTANEIIKDPIIQRRPFRALFYIIRFELIKKNHKLNFKRKSVIFCFIFINNYYKNKIINYQNLFLS